MMAALNRRSLCGTVQCKCSYLTFKSAASICGRLSAVVCLFFGFFACWFKSRPHCWNNTQMWRQNTVTKLAKSRQLNHICKSCRFCFFFFFFGLSNLNGYASLSGRSASLPAGQREQTSVLTTGIRCQFLVLRRGWWCQGWNLEQSTSSVCWRKTNWAQAHSAKL